MPQHERLLNQLMSLERTVSRGGKDTISHPHLGHDDIANAVAGAAVGSKYPGYDISMSWV